MGNALIRKLVLITGFVILWAICVFVWSNWLYHQISFSLNSEAKFAWYSVKEIITNYLVLYNKGLLVEFDAFDNGFIYTLLVPAFILLIAVRTIGMQNKSSDKNETTTGKHIRGAKWATDNELKEKGLV